MSSTGSAPAKHESEITGLIKQTLASSSRPRGAYAQSVADAVTAEHAKKGMSRKPCREMVLPNSCLPWRLRKTQRATKRCGHPAWANGYCEIHQPRRKLEKIRQRITRLQEQLAEAIEEERRLTNVEHVSG